MLGEGPARACVCKTICLLPDRQIVPDPSRAARTFVSVTGMKGSTVLSALRLPSSIRACLFDLDAALIP
jgi:hypothetical protein